jgi:hypothetical protein
MVPLQVYKLVHLLGILMLFLSLGGLILYANDGGAGKQRWRRLLFVTHGTGILLALLGGFGLLARLGIVWPWPGWVAAKFTIWIVFAGLPALVIRNPSWTRTFWWTILALGGTAAYLAGQKPF